MSDTVLTLLLTAAGTGIVGVVSYLIRENAKLRSEVSFLRNLVFKTAMGIKDLDDPSPRRTATEIADEILLELQNYEPLA